ncbi:MAG: peroxiredoxin-like family protein [Aggregatilineales bacterium]
MPSLFASLKSSTSPLHPTFLSDKLLAEQLQKGPVVLAFYRGAWCPYCNLQLRAYQAILPEITNLGATLVAVSPQAPDYSIDMVTKANLTFPVLSDAGNLVAREYRLVFTLPEALRPYTANLPQYNHDDSWELPLPGTFVIGPDGVIRLAFTHADYTKRLEPTDILRTLHHATQ